LKLCNFLQRVTDLNIRADKISAQFKSLSIKRGAPVKRHWDGKAKSSKSRRANPGEKGHLWMATN
jgi:hypothetical protein